MKISSKVLVAVIAFFLNGCTNMAPEMPLENQGQSGCIPQFPDKNITYDNYIKGIVANHCIICHQGGNSPGLGNFSTYNGVLLYTGFFNLHVTQDHADMPQGNAPLPKSMRDSISIWINNCTPEK